MTATLLGHLAMLALGLVILAAVARLMGVEGERTFLLPAPLALAAAFAIGFAACFGVALVLGLLDTRQLEAYEARRPGGAGRPLEGQPRRRPSAHRRPGRL